MQYNKTCSNFTLSLNEMNQESTRRVTSTRGRVRISTGLATEDRRPLKRPKSQKTKPGGLIGIRRYMKNSIRRDLKSADWKDGNLKTT